MKNVFIIAGVLFGALSQCRVTGMSNVRKLAVVDGSVTIPEVTFPSSVGRSDLFFHLSYPSNQYSNYERCLRVMIGCRGVTQPWTFVEGSIYHVNLTSGGLHVSLNEGVLAVFQNSCTAGSVQLSMEWSSHVPNSPTTLAVRAERL
jgi:hypothetical protein